MTNRAQRALLAQETLDILTRGSYRNRHGNVVDLQQQQTRAMAGTIHYRAADLAALEYRDFPQAFITRIDVVNETRLSAARRLLNDGATDVLCLNFASAKNPGGGFLGGSEAQEESLAKSSGLYPCLLQKMELYEANRAMGSSFYLHDMIYSPQVPVFRDDSYALLDETYSVSFVTSAAVNRGAIEANAPGRLAEVPAVMCSRINKLLALALTLGHVELVLGAWGCGVFRNEPEEMASWFRQSLESQRFRGAFKRIIFAVYDRGNGKTHGAFASVFGQGEK